MSGAGGGPSDEKDGRIKQLEAEKAELLKRGQATLSGQMRRRAERKEREAAAQKVFGKHGKRR